MIELNSSKVVISDEEHGIQIEFSGQNELEYFLVQRHFDEDDFVSVFYTEGCGTSGHWTFIHVTLDEKTIVFSFDREPVKVTLNISPTKYKQLKRTLKKLVGLLGMLTENGSR